MAKDPKEAAEVIELEDEGTVTVELPGLAAAAEEEEEPKSAVQQERKRLSTQQLKSVEEAEAEVEDEAATALQEAAANAAKEREAAEARARAAEATAAAERQRAEDAQRRVLAAEQQTKSALEEAADRELELISNSLENTKSEKDALEGQLADAMERGDFKLSAAIQGKLATTAARLDRLETTKTNLENRPEPTVKSSEEVSSATNSRQEQFLAQFTPASQNWLRQHPECMPPAVGGTPTAYSKMMAGHYAAVGDGLSPESPEYFRKIEEYTGHRKVEQANEVATEGTGEEASARTQVRTPPKQPKIIPAAAPSREPPMSSNANRNARQVTLNPQQKEAARFSFPHLSERDAYVAYAKNLVELESEGQMGRLTH